MSERGYHPSRNSACSGAATTSATPVRGLSADGYAGRADVGSLAVTDVVTAVRSADEAKARATSAARPDVPGEVVAQLLDADVE